MFKKIFLLVAIIVLNPCATKASASDGTIDVAYHTAWSPEIGWINFAADTRGVYVSDTALTGFIWNENAGWINLSPENSNQKVTNNGAGQLSGFAWSEGSGWISFTGITIDEQGKFHGTSASTTSNSNHITFDCDQCDVRTDWRPTRMRSVTPIVTPPPMSGIQVIEPPVPDKIIPPETNINSVPTTLTTSTQQNIIHPMPIIFVHKQSPIKLFTKNLYFGIKHPEVKNLQIFLNTHGFLVAVKGPGSIGNETEFFGQLTVKAVKSFQEYYAHEILRPLNLKKATGQFYEKTRTKINSLLLK